MGLIHVTKDSRKVSFIGLAKNTGKTVALQKLLDEIRINGEVCGLTSIGHDGEEFDQLNILIRKPRIFVSEGYYVATTDKLFSTSIAKCKIIHTTGYNTPLGRVEIGIVEKPGLIEVAGPSTSSGVNHVAELMLEFGAGKILIDGAINRRAISAPEYSDGLIISTGAILDRDIVRAVNETAETVAKIKLPVFNHGIPTEGFNGVAFISGDGCVLHSQESIMSDQEGFLKAISNDKVKTIYSNKPIVESVINEMAEICERNARCIVLVLSDYTRLFPGQKSISFYKKKGIEIRVFNPSNLLALTVNPVAPLSHSFDSVSFQHQIRMKVDGIPVYDVMDPHYQ